jgi:hypothetical protein
MVAPFLLFDGSDVCLFRTIESLAAYVESPDVANYLAIDSSGRVVRLEPSTASQGSRIGLVSVLPVMATLSTDVVDEAQLRGRLVQFLRQLTGEGDETATVEQLVREVEKRVGYTQ